MVHHAGTEQTAPAVPYVGIDFGTSKSAVAWYNPRTGQADILKNAEEQDATPSAVYFGKDQTLVGQEALNTLEDAEEAGDIEEARRVWINVKRELDDGAPRFLDGQLVYPFRVAKEIFAKLRRDAEEYHFHRPVRRAVVTCPASFNVVQRDKIRHAALAAGFTEVELLDEPVAAAIAYAASGLDVGRQVLVYDLGGGTFDVAMLTREPHNGAFRLAATPEGIANYGGNAFDLALYDYCRQRVAEAQGGDEGEGTGAPVSQPFLQRCRECKEALSSKEAAKLSTFVSSNGQLQRFQETVTRAIFEDLIRDKVEATVRLAAAMEERARQAGEPVDTVVLVGSSSRIPLVKELLDESLPIPPRKWEKQGIAVGLGAAYYAHRLWSPGGEEATTKGPDPVTIIKVVMEMVKKLPVSSSSKYRKLLTEAQRRGAVIGPQVRDVREQLRVMVKELGVSPGQAETIEREVLGTTLTGGGRTNGHGGDLGEPPEATTDVVMPELRGQQPVGTVVRWLKRVGDLVGEGETLAEVETDQVQAGVGAPVRGLLVEVLAPVGAQVPFGQTMARVRIWTDADALFVTDADVSLGAVLQPPFAVSPADGLIAGFQKSMTGTRLCVYRLPEGERVHAFLTDPGRCQFSGDGGLLAKVGINVVPVWDLATAKKATDLGIRGRLLMVPPVDLAFTSRDRLFVAYNDNRVLRWDVDTRTHRQIGTPSYKPLLAAQPDGRIVITAGEGIDLWDGDGGGRVGTIPLPNVRPTAIAVSTDSRQLALAGQDGVVRLWDLDTQQSVAAYRMWFAADTLSFSPDAAFLACCRVRGSEGSTTAVTWVLNLENGQPCFVRGAATFAAFMADGRLLTVQRGIDQVGLWTRREDTS